MLRAIKIALKKSIVSVFRGIYNTSAGKIIIGDDCWIAANAVITSGVVIGSHSIVGAGAVVTSDIEPYSIIGGVPARLIKKR